MENSFFFDCENPKSRLVFLDEILNNISEIKIFCETPNGGWKDYFEEFFNYYIKTKNPSNIEEINFWKKIILNDYLGVIFEHQPSKVSVISVRSGDFVADVIFWIIAEVVQFNNIGDDKYIITSVDEFSYSEEWFKKIAQLLFVGGGLDIKSYAKELKDVLNFFDFFSVMPFWGGSVALLSIKNPEIRKNIRSKFSCFDRVVDYSEEIAFSNPYDGPEI